jgi:hypothetical protein
MQLGGEGTRQAPTQAKADPLAPTLVQGSEKPSFTPLTLADDTPKERYTLELNERSEDSAPQQPDQQKPWNPQPQAPTAASGWNVTANQPQYGGGTTTGNSAFSSQSTQQSGAAKPAQPGGPSTPTSNSGDGLGVVYRDDSPRDNASSNTLLRGYTKTRDEVEEDRRFEEQKRALEERAERLRRLSFNVKSTEGSDELENVPAYMRKNTTLGKDGQSSNDAGLSGYSIGVNPEQGGGQAHIQTLNTFLEGKKPD